LYKLSLIEFTRCFLLNRARTHLFSLFRLGLRRRGDLL
jgi:hypothetical protein